MADGLIDGLDKTIVQLLKQENDAIMSQVDISFAMPDDEFSKSVTGFTTNLFLYDIRENVTLRGVEGYAASSVSRIEAEMKTASIKRPPIQVDLSYLITAWGTDAATKAKQEHYLLGVIMKILLRYPTIPQKFLAEPLQQLPFLPSARLLHPSLLQSAGEFWSAMNGKPKPTLNYTVTLAVDAFAETPVNLINENVMELTQK